MNDSDVCAEIHTLSKMKCDKNDAIVLLYSDTDDGEKSSNLLKEEIQARFGAEVRSEKVCGLQVKKAADFNRLGMISLYEKLKPYEGNPSVEICGTGGYKGMVAMATFFAMINGNPVRYIYESGAEMITYPALPVTYDKDFFFENERALEKLYSDIMPAANLKSNPRLHNVCDIDPDSGEATLSALGRILFDRFRIDYPQDIRRTDIPADSKQLNLADHHGKEELGKYARKIILHEFVEEIISAEWKGQTKKTLVKIDPPFIEMRIPSDRGYVLRIKTTAKDASQAEEVAKILKEKYW